MPTTAETWQRLRVTPQLVADAMAASGDLLVIQSDLRSRHPAELVPTAMQLREMRAAAGGKLPRAEQMWGTTLTLEQATHQRVATHKAKRFASAGEPVADLCCGMGADAIALAAAGMAVEAVDLRPEALLFTRWNAEAVGVADRVRTREADVTTLRGDGLVHLDPDRRPGGRRVRRLSECRPDLAFMQRVAAGKGGAIKLSPASDFGGKFDGCEIELVSLEGECREATVWFGSLADGETMRATVLRGDQSATLAGDPLDAIAEVADLGDVLIDPDPAVVRAGLVDLLCERAGLSRLDPAEEYLTGPADTPNPPSERFGACFRVIDRCGNNPKQIRRLLDAHDVGRLEVKTRHVQADANALQRKYQRQPSEAFGGHPLTLFLARLRGKTTAVLTQRVRTAHENRRDAVTTSRPN